MKRCPRCKRMNLHDEQVLNRLSRRDSKTYICNECGGNEAFIDLGLMRPDKKEREFVASLKLKGK